MLMMKLRPPSAWCRRPSKITRRSSSDVVKRTSSLKIPNSEQKTHPATTNCGSGPCPKEPRSNGRECMKSTPPLLYSSRRRKDRARLASWCKEVWATAGPWVQCPEWKEGEKHPGIFRFRFWKFGEWKEVVVDDRLPTSNGKLIYCASRGDVEFWAPLMEKAYAKLHGSYEALDSGSTSDAMVDFTGGICETIDLADKQSLQEADDMTLWKKLKRASNNQQLMGCALKSGKNLFRRELMECSDRGIIKDHAYGICEARHVRPKGVRGALGMDKHRLIRVRNPWGEKEWNGPWSDNSAEWKAISEKEKRRLNLIFEEDGSFWMAYSDFIKNYNVIYICHSPNTDYLSLEKRWNLSSFKNEWVKGVSAGGCSNNKSCTTNPQYFFTLEEASSMWVALMQMDRRLMNKSQGQIITIGFIVIKTQDNRKERLNHVEDVVERKSFINSRELVREMHLEPGRYCVLPSTFDPNLETKFLLRIFSEKPAQVHIVERVGPRNHWYMKKPLGAVRVEVVGARNLKNSERFDTQTGALCVVYVPPPPPLH
eukprot:TRINITY_DN1543_c0_g1_i1.p1 TRINITY_DN1543_c0_g1~~TRINITY_DN1543_c0_g1_i1.p1  ORF type:complete len:540 (+),score=82.35 TRINITY_DN1543_c0_g1_i1:377-1996(+)